MALRSPLQSRANKKAGPGNESGVLPPSMKKRLSILAYPILHLNCVYGSEAIFAFSGYIFLNHQFIYRLLLFFAFSAFGPMIENGIDNGYNDQGKEQRTDQTANNRNA